MCDDPTDFTFSTDLGNILLVDVLMGGAERTTGCFLVGNDRKALIDCGPALSYPRLRTALDNVLGERAKLDYLILTHIHPDHAGAAGKVARDFPDLKVVVAPQGYPHVVDPQRLNASARMTFGDRMDTVIGDSIPVNRGQVISSGDGIEIKLGDDLLSVFSTPGHMHSHISVYYREQRAMFVGDAIGTFRPGMHCIRPATPAPQFDINAARASLDRFRTFDIDSFCLPHFGIWSGNPGLFLDSAVQSLELWFSAVKEGWLRGSDPHAIEESLIERFARYEAPAERSFIDTRGASSQVAQMYRANTLGLLRYLDRECTGK